MLHALRTELHTLQVYPVCCTHSKLHYTPTRVHPVCCMHSKHYTPFVCRQYVVFIKKSGTLFQCTQRVAWAQILHAIIRHPEYWRHSKGNTPLLCAQRADSKDKTNKSWQWPALIVCSACWLKRQNQQKLTVTRPYYVLSVLTQMTKPTKADSDTPLLCAQRAVSKGNR